MLDKCLLGSLQRIYMSLEGRRKCNWIYQWQWRYNSRHNLWQIMPYNYCGCRAVAGQVGGRRDYAKTRTQVATSQRQTRLREDAAQTRNVAASQRQTRQRQTRLREDANTSRNVAASDATTRRRRPNSQRHSVRRDNAKKEPKLATSQRRSAKPNGNRSCTHTAYNA